MVIAFLINDVCPLHFGLPFSCGKQTLYAVNISLLEFYTKIVGLKIVKKFSGNTNIILSIVS